MGRKKNERREWKGPMRKCRKRRKRRKKEEMKENWKCCPLLLVGRWP
jgi:hypothetical protein